MMKKALFMPTLCPEETRKNRNASPTLIAPNMLNTEKKIVPLSVAATDQITSRASPWNEMFLPMKILLTLKAWLKKESLPSVERKAPVNTSLTHGPQLATSMLESPWTSLSKSHLQFEPPSKLESEVPSPLMLSILWKDIPAPQLML